MNRLTVRTLAVAALGLLVGAVGMTATTADGHERRSEPTRPVSEIAACWSADPVESAEHYRPCVWPGTPSRICFGGTCVDYTPTKPFVVPETGAAYRTSRRMAQFLLGLGMGQGAGRTLDCAVSAPHPCPYALP